MLFIPAAAILGIIITLFWYGNLPVEVSAEARLRAKIEYFTRLANDDSIPLQSILDEGEKIIADFGTPGNRVQKLMLENLRGLMVKAELRRLRIENLNLKNRLRAARRENAVIRQQLGSTVSRESEK